MKRTTLSRRNAWNGVFMILPLLLGCMVFYTAPFIIVLRNALFKGIGNSEQFVGLENFREMMSNDGFRLAFGNTMKFLVISLPLILVISFGIALVLKEEARKHETLKSVLLLPYILPVAATVLLVEWLFAETGVLNHCLNVIGLPIADWLDSGQAFWVVVGLYLWKNTGYAVILLLSGLVTIPEDHYDVSGLDGATFGQQLRYITIPQMWYSVFFTVVFSLINAFKCFREIFLIGGTHPHSSIYMLQHFLNNTFENLSYPKMAVVSVVLALILTTVFALSYYWVMKKEAYKA